MGCGLPSKTESLLDGMRSYRKQSQTSKGSLWAENTVSHFRGSAPSVYRLPKVGFPVSSEYHSHDQAANERSEERWAAVSHLWFLSRQVLGSPTESFLHEKPAEPVEGGNGHSCHVDCGASVTSRAGAHGAPAARVARL